MDDACAARSCAQGPIGARSSRGSAVARYAQNSGPVSAVAVAVSRPAAATAVDFAGDAARRGDDDGRAPVPASVADRQHEEAAVGVPSAPGAPGPLGHA